MEVRGYLELKNALDEAGYDRLNLAPDVMDIYQRGTFGGGIRVREKIGGKTAILKFHFDFNRGGRITITGLEACLLSERLRQVDLPIHQRVNVWQGFEGLPTIEQVFNALVEHKQSINHQKNDNMNLNNLEDLKEQMKALGFKDKLIEQMEEKMKKDVPDFKLHDTLPATKGQVDLTLHFKQSGQSDFYYFNKFEAAHNMGKPLEEGQKYLVISPNPEKQGENLFKKFENVGEAIAFFKEQKGTSELAIGKDAAHKTMVATMEKDKVNYVSKDFNRTFYAKPVDQTFWIERGKGFSAEQASNLVQGRAVYRDDMMNLGGQPYKAWVKLDFDKGKERNNNFSTNQYHDPSYGFHLETVLEKYKIKEMEDPAKAVLLDAALRNGGRPLITTEKDGQPVKLYVEAVPRYSQLNMYAENSKPEKREQFLKEPAVDKTLSQNKGKEMELEQSQGVKR